MCQFTCRLHPPTHGCALFHLPPPVRPQQFVSKWLFHFSDDPGLSKQQLQKLQKQVGTLVWLSHCSGPHGQGLICLMPHES